jgi:hypothetical protein
MGFLLMVVAQTGLPAFFGRRREVYVCDRENRCRVTLEFVFWFLGGNRGCFGGLLNPSGWWAVLGVRELTGSGSPDGATKYASATRIAVATDLSGSVRKRKSSRQVESNERCPASDWPWDSSGPPSSLTRSRTTRSIGRCRMPPSADS